ncbi:hypothetical protein HK102_003554, partial [Quaeritorhiza haematococci]
HESTPETAKFQFFEWRATKRPFREHDIELQEGRIPIHFLLDKIGGGASELHLNDILLSHDKNGLSFHRFTPNETHRLKVKRAKTVDEEIKFSENLDSSQMHLDFGINEAHQIWDVDDSTFQRQAPDAMLALLDLFLQFNTARLEAARRYIISTFLLYALDSVAPGRSPQCIDEECGLAYVLTRKTDQAIINVKYHGAADFVVGHSRSDSKMPEDATVLVIEVKRGQTFEGSFKQVLAQAATALKTREEKNRGVDQKGGPVYFVLSDGWNWTFSRLVSGGGEQEQDSELIVQEGSTLILSKTKKRIEGQRRELFIREAVDKVFSWLCFVIEQSRDASPRTSLSGLDM